MRCSPDCSSSLGVGAMVAVDQCALTQCCYQDYYVRGHPIVPVKLAGASIEVRVGWEPFRCTARTCDKSFRVEDF
jgi:hypothetical protein